MVSCSKLPLAEADEETVAAAAAAEVVAFSEFTLPLATALIFVTDLLVTDVKPLPPLPALVATATEDEELAELVEIALDRFVSVPGFILTLSQHSHIFNCG